MSFKEEVYNFLTQPENLEIAFEIGKYLEDMKRKLEEIFWTELHKGLEAKLGNEDNWYIDKDDVKVMRNYEGIGIEPDNIKPGGLYLYVRLEKEGRRSFFGISIWKNNADEFDGSLSKVESLIGDLRNKLRAKGYKPEKAWWVGWKYLDSRSFDDLEVCRQIADKTYQAEAVEEIWSLFQDVRKDLDDINSKLNRT